MSKIQYRLSRTRTRAIADWDMTDHNLLTVDDSDHAR